MTKNNSTTHSKSQIYSKRQTDSKNSYDLQIDGKKPITLFNLGKQYFGIYQAARDMKSSFVRDILGDGKVAKVVNLLPISRVVSVAIGAVAVLFFRKSGKTT